MPHKSETTQADRDAAADAIWFGEFSNTERVEQSIRDQDEDNHQMVQAFARHRLSSTATKDARIAELEEALRDVRDNGLIYWEPNTQRGETAKALMFRRIDSLLTENQP